MIPGEGAQEPSKSSSEGLSEELSEADEAAIGALVTKAVS